MAQKKTCLKNDVWSLGISVIEMAEGKNPFTIDSKPATADYKDFIMGEARYSSLTRSFPERAEVLFDKAAETAKARRAHLEKLLKLYVE